MDGSRSNETGDKLDAVSNYVDVSDGYADGKITISSTNDCSFTVAKNGNNYSVKSHSGFYIGGASGNNVLNASATQAYEVSISYTNGVFDLVSNTSHLRYNKASDNKRFRFFKSDSYSSQQAVYLYKLIDPPTFRSHSLSLDGQIGVNFYLELPAGFDYADAGMTFAITHGACTESVPFVASGEQATPKNDDGQYRFTCYINSIQMAETITATFHYKMNGNEYTVTNAFSAADYFAYYDNNPTAFNNLDATTRDLIHATKNYGYYVQQFLQPEKNWTFRTDNDPVTAGYKALTGPYGTELPEETTVRSDNANVIPFTKTNSTANYLETMFEKVTYSLVLDSATTIKVFFKLNSGKSMPDVSLPEGVSYTKTQQADGRWVVAITNIKADHLGDPYTITLGSNDATVKVSVLSYVNSMLNEVDANAPNGAWTNNNHKAAPDAWDNAALAIYSYWSCAKAYRTNH